MADNAKKLGIKPGQTMAVVNAPQEYPAALGTLPDGVTVTDKFDKPVDFVLIFAQMTRDVEKSVPAAQKVSRPDGPFWVSYPKGSSKVKTDLNRDILWKQVDAWGLVGVSLISLDETWSAMRLRPKDKVGK